jgi:multidrug efflux system membrane fusion protein
MTIQPRPRSIEGGARRQDTDIRPYRRYLIGGGALILVLVAFYWWTHSGNQAGPRRTPAVPVQVSAAVQRDMPMVKDTIGTVVSPTTVSIIPRVQGQLTRIYFKEGQTVKAGDLLFEIDPRPYRAALDQAKGQLAKDQGALDGAQRDLKRFQSLRALNAISQQVVDDALATVEVDTGTVGADKANVEMAELNLEFCEIRSPVDGKTGPIQVQTGNVIFSSATAPPLVTIAQIKPIKISYALPQSDLPAIQARAKEGKLVAAITPHGAGADKKLTAPVDFVSNVMSNAGTIELRSDFANEDEALVPGELVDVTVQLDDIRGAIVVPRVAVINGPNGTFVYRVNQGAVEQVPVQVAFDDGTDMAIKGDISAGDNVVSDGGLRVTPSSKVTIQHLTTRPAGGRRGARGAKGARGGGAEKSL